MLFKRDSKQLSPITTTLPTLQVLGNTYDILTFKITDRIAQG